jgi:chaperonin cofactor prefoldin
MENIRKEQRDARIKTLRREIESIKSQIDNLEAELFEKFALLEKYEKGEI